MVLDLLDPDLTNALDLPTIDLSAAADNGAVRFDRRSHEERYAELGFGLGTVARRQQRDDAWWETPTGMLAVIVVLILMVWATTT